MATDNNGDAKMSGTEDDNLYAHLNLSEDELIYAYALVDLYKPSEKTKEEWEEEKKGKTIGDYLQSPIPSNVADKWESKKKQAIDNEKSKDAQRYKEWIDEWLPEETEDRVTLAKKKVLYQIVIRRESKSSDAKDLPSVAEQIESGVENAVNDEELSEVYWYMRGCSMTDEEWGKEKAVRIKEDEDDLDKKYKADREEELAKMTPEERQKALDEEKREKEENEKLKKESQEATEKRHAEIKEESNKVIDLPDVPPEVRKIHRQMLPIIFGWWEKSVQTQDSGNFTTLSHELRAIKMDQYIPAHTYIEHFMENIKKLSAACEISPKEEDVKQLCKSALQLTNTLRKHGLDWKMIASMEIHRRILKILRRSQDKDVKMRTKLFEDSYLASRSQQLETLKLSDLITQYLVQALENGNPDQFILCVDQLKSLNTTLGETNSNLNLRSTDHNLPVSDLNSAADHLKRGDLREMVRTIASYAYKVDRLGIAIHSTLREWLDKHRITSSDLDTTHLDDQILGIALEVQPGNEVDGVPRLLGMAQMQLYPNAFQKTVAWGDHLGRWYINQYGPRSSPIWRKEILPDPEWMQKWGKDNCPLALKITNEMNRKGGEKHRGSGRKRFGVEYIEGIYGVAFVEDRRIWPDPVEYLNPDNHDRKYDSSLPTWGYDYVLVGWWTDMSKIDTVKTWEPRSVLRERYPTGKADEHIYNSACKSQVRFEAWYNGSVDARDESPEPLRPQHASPEPLQHQYAPPEPSPLRYTPPEPARARNAHRKAGLELASPVISGRDIVQSIESPGLRGPIASRLGRRRMGRTRIATRSMTRGTQDVDDIRETLNSLRLEFDNDMGTVDLIMDKKFGVAWYEQLGRAY